ncbi:type I glyceraldehyde-3-phosphate dehydrogenase [Candidatus Peregrinibacteria bacterium]|nr:type I glyceraldehyde-3-phosphate dehydrogenase [Candidatus Peregrinibacteria bacterium]
MSIRIAINGYGRIGRGLHRMSLKDKDLEIVAINSRSGADSHAYLLKHDSLYGTVDADIKVVDDNLMVEGKKVSVYQIANPAELDWRKDDVDIVIESTGHFTTMEHAQKHLDAGAKRVIITAPCDDERVENVVMGVNHQLCSKDGCRVVSNASCTTNCLAPVLKVLNEEFGIETSFVTTIHAFTYTQNLLDNSNPEDFRRARATTESIIPTSTGAMRAIGRVIPELHGKVEGMAFRVPVPTVSCIDLVAKLEKKVDVDKVNAVFKKYEKGELKGILGTNDEPLVSVDYRGDSRSAIIDTLSTAVLHDNYVKVIAWYDNEWGYISRIVDLLKWFK